MGKVLFMRKGETHTAPTKGLPSGFTKLAYIQSSGTQYVDTGVVPNNKGGVHYIDKNRIEAAVKTLRRRTERGEDR